MLGSGEPPAVASATFRKRVSRAYARLRLLPVRREDHDGGGAGGKSVRVRARAHVPERARRLAVSCSSQNAAARRILEKAGLRQEGEFVKSWFDGREWVNVLWYALLKEERDARA